MTTLLVFLGLIVKISAFVSVDELDPELQTLISNRNYTVRCEFLVDGNSSVPHNASIRVGDCQPVNAGFGYELASNWSSSSALVARVTPRDMAKHRFLLLSCCESASVEKDPQEALLIVCGELKRLQLEQQQTTDKWILVNVRPTEKEQQEALKCSFSRVERVITVQMYSDNGTLLDTVPCLRETAEADVLAIGLMSSLNVSRMMINATDVHYEIPFLSSKLEVQRSSVILPLRYDKTSVSQLDSTICVFVRQSEGFELSEIGLSFPLSTKLIIILIGTFILLLAIAVLAVLWWLRKRSYCKRKFLPKSQSPPLLGSHLRIENEESAADNDGSNIPDLQH